MLDDVIKQIKHKSAIARSFSRAATTYDQVALLQKEIGSRLLDRLDFIKFNPQTILDLGGGTGFFNESLLKKYPTADIIHCDIAEGMVSYAKKVSAKLDSASGLKSKINYICADGDFLPIQNQTVDFVFSNCALQWFPDLSYVFQEIQRILKPNGLFLFSTFGQDTLIELRSSFAQIDNRKHVNTFLDMHDIGDQLLEQAFQDPVMDMEKITLTYNNIKGLISDLKLTGAHTVYSAYSRLSPKTTFKRLAENYEIYRMQEGQLPATFEIVYGHAWSDSFVMEDAQNERSSCLKKIPLPILQI